MNNDTKTPAGARIPLIDISALRGTDAAAYDSVAAALREACEQRGFFYIANHGVDAELIGRVFEQNKQFFAQPMDAKLPLDKKWSKHNRGYEPLKAQTLEAGAPPDLKESFYIGNEVAADDARVLAGAFNTGPNQWPPGLPGFRETMDEYFGVAQELGGLIVRALGRSLALPADFFDAYVDDALATIRLLHYPPQPGNPLPGEKGCGEHTDFGGVTLLLQDDSGGLQVWDAQDAGWIDAPPIAGTYVVNIGDLFARWTNGRYRSTLHRVINVSGHERYSVPFFYTGNPLVEVKCLPNCLAPGEVPQFETVTVEGHLRDCYRRTYA
jgi:isopenicillin N synthase-like dioxygenase